MKNSNNAIRLAVMITVFTGLTNLARGQASPSESDLLQKAVQATVYIKVDRVYRNITMPTSGSGFFVSPEGFLISNWHVVAPQVETEIYGKATEVSTTIGSFDVVVNSGTKDELRLPGRVIALDRKRDLAIVHVRHRPKTWLSMAKNPNVRLATSIWAIGYPFGELVSRNKGNPEVTLTAGRVTALRHDEKGDPEFVQIDAAVNPGNSGGPLLLANSEVIGVISAGISSGNSTSFAIAPERLGAFLNENQVRIKAEPDSVWVRATPIKLTISPLLQQIQGLRCYYQLTGGDIEPALGELAWSGADFTGKINVPARREGITAAKSYQLAISLKSSANEVVLARELQLLVREGMTPQVNSDRNPADMMRDRALVGNRTEGRDQAIYLGPESTPPARATNRTALTDLAKTVKIKKQADGSPAVIGNQNLALCQSDPNPENYTGLRSEKAHRLAEGFDQTECSYKQLSASLQSTSSSSRSSYIYNYYYSSDSGVPRQKNQEKLTFLAGELRKLHITLISNNVCRCPNGKWYEGDANSACMPCTAPEIGFIK